MKASTALEVLFSPAEFAALPARDLSETVCVVFDVLRATSTMVTALHHGTADIVPVTGIPEALDRRRLDPSVLLAGERAGVRIRGHLTGGTDFDLGNSPREFTPERIASRRIVMTTTNGTRALRACAGAKAVWIGSFLNLSATARRVQDARQLLVICSGTGEQAAYEDALGAGALCDLLWARFENGNVADSARIAQRLYLAEKQDLAAALGKSSNGFRLASQPELAPDVPICAQRDLYDLAAKMGKDGVIRKEI